MPRSRPILERFQEKYRIDPKTGCWIWQASRVRRGYGMLGGGPGKGDVLAHRFAYEHFVGPIPPGKIIMHTCDTPPCVNPDHLRIGTHQENMADGKAKGRGRIMSKAQVREAIRLQKGGLSLIRIAAQMGFSRPTITRAIEMHWTTAPDKVTAFVPKPWRQLTPGERRVVLALLDAGHSVMWIAEQMNIDRKTVRNIRDKAAGIKDVVDLMDHVASKD